MTSSSSPSSSGLSRRLILICDGTAQQRDWIKSPRISSVIEPVVAEGDEKYFSNVALLARCIPSLTSSGVSQIVYYQSGIGTGTGLLQNLYERATGFALSNKIQEAYGFLVDNYTETDQLFLFGFSRGAYTARCISGFINWCGILTKQQFSHFNEIWTAYQNRDPEDEETDRQAAEVLYKYTGRYPSQESDKMVTLMNDWNLDHPTGRCRPKMSDQEKEKRKTECRKRIQLQQPKTIPPRIKVVGVWDTVRALGIPGWFQSKTMSRFFNFYDPGLGSHISFGFHALSLAEDRKGFLPTLWIQPPPPSSDSKANNQQVLKQVWFNGVHSDVGGGYLYHGTSDLALIWMVSQLIDLQTLPDGSVTTEPLLDLDLEMLSSFLDRRRGWSKQPEQSSRFFLQFQKYRQVGSALLQSPPVWNCLFSIGSTTNESIHPSVITSGTYSTATSPPFQYLNQTDPKKLNHLWTSASCSASLRPLEKSLQWSTTTLQPTMIGAVDALHENPIPLQQFPKLHKFWFLTDQLILVPFQMINSVVNFKITPKRTLKRSVLNKGWFRFGNWVVERRRK